MFPQTLASGRETCPALPSGYTYNPSGSGNAIASDRRPDSGTDAECPDKTGFPGGRNGRPESNQIARRNFDTSKENQRSQLRVMLTETISEPFEYLYTDRFSLKEMKETKLEVHSKNESKALIPVTIAAIIAALGTVGMLVIHLGPGSRPEGRGIGIISAATADKAGAIITPSVPELSIEPTPPGPRPLFPAAGPMADTEN